MIGLKDIIDTVKLDNILKKKTKKNYLTGTEWSEWKRDILAESGWNF